MKNKRRDFLRSIGLTGFGLFSGIRLEAFHKSVHDHSMVRGGKQHFNMSGYAAPKIDTVRVGFIGLGNRGPAHLRDMDKLEKVEIKALCDLRPEKVMEAKKLIKNNTQSPAIYTDKVTAWKELCESNDIDLIFIATPWEMHTPMALYAMEQGKHVCTEVPAAVTLEECWQLVETSERTRKYCMMMENCCYDFFELLTLNLARQGYFGDIINGEGAYIDNLLDENFDKNHYWKMWRLEYNTRWNGNLYPTHGLGPICQIMNINRGDKMDYMVSMSSNDFEMEKKAEKLAATDPFYAPYVDTQYRGNINTSTIRTNKGRLIVIKHDVTSPEVYSRIHKVVGTEGTALKYPLPGKISHGRQRSVDWLNDKEMSQLKEKYQPAIVKRVGELAKKVGGHGGMDFLMDWRTIDCIRNGLPLDQDVYDAASWSCIFPLSIKSINNRSGSIDIPDFTRGAWKNNKPVDILLDKGGNTKINL